MAVEVRVSINRAKLIGAVHVPVRRDLRLRTERVAAQARATAPGSMSRSISTTYERIPHGEMGRIILSHRAAGYVTLGTRPHLIVPVTARALRFTVGGRVVYAKRVNHPGNGPNTFLVDALGAAA
jgi:hypothetical protein